MKYLRKYNAHNDFLDDFENIEENRITPHVIQCDDPNNDELDVHFHLNIPIYADTSENERGTSFVKRSSGGGSNIYDISYGELQSIKGVSLVWNQMISDPKETVYTCPQYHINVGNIQNRDENTIAANHKIYVSCDVKFSEDFGYSVGVEPQIGICASGNLYGDWGLFDVVKDNQWHHASFIIKSLNGNNKNIDIRRGYSSSTNTGTFQVKNVNAIDLTLMWGFGNEPTKAYFESLFPLEWYDFCLPKFLNFCPYALISKDELGNVIDSVILDIPNITGKLNGEGTSETVFPNSSMCSGSMKPKNSLGNSQYHDRYDELYKEDGIWKAKIVMKLDDDLSNNTVLMNDATPYYYGIQAPNKTGNDSNDVIMTRYATWDERPSNGNSEWSSSPQRTCNSVYHAWPLYINVRDYSRYSDASSLKTAMVNAGTSMMYALNNESLKIYVLDDTYQANLNKKLKIVKGGYEEIVLTSNMDSNGSLPVTAPARLTIKYTGEN